MTAPRTYFAVVNHLTREIAIRTPESPQELRYRFFDPRGISDRAIGNVAKNLYMQWLEAEAGMFAMFSLGMFNGDREQAMEAARSFLLRDHPLRIRIRRIPTA